MLNTEFGVRLMATKRAFSRALEAEIVGHDLTVTQFRVLRRLWTGDGIGSAQLGKDANMDGATLTGVIDRLEAKGLLKRERHESDRRAVRLWLTDAGRELEKPLMEALGRINGRALCGFSEAERAAMLGLLSRIELNLTLGHDLNPNEFNPETEIGKEATANNGSNTD